MTIEMNENASVAAVFCCGFVMLAACILGGCHIEQKTQTEAIKAGLIQQVQPGSSVPRWVRPDGENK